MKNVFLCFFFLMSTLIFGQSEAENVIKKSQKSLDSLINKGYDDLKKNNVTLSIISLNKALKLANTLNDLDKISRIYNMIGINYHLIDDIKSADTFYYKSFEAAKSGNLDKRQSVAAANISLCKYLAGDYASAKKYADISIELSKKSANKHNELMTYINLIRIYIKTDDLASAKQIVSNLNQRKEELKEFNLIEGYNFTLAAYYDYAGDEKMANTYYKNAILNSSKGSFFTVQSIRLDYANFLYQNKDYEEAFFQLKLHLEESKKITNEERKKISQTLGVIENAYQTTEELERIKETNKAVNDTLSRYQLFLGLIIALLLATVISLCFLSILYKKRSNLLKIVNKNNEDLKAAHEKTIELSNVKSKFIATITHELRTPLYGIIGLSEILNQENKSEHSNSHLKSLNFSAKYLLSLVNDILSVNKIEENDKKALSEDTYNLKDEVGFVFETLEPLKNENKNQYVVNIDSQIPNEIITDKLKLTQIFMNLLGNAMKFTKDGTITFSAFLASKTDTHVTINFSVQDTGKGISEENQNKIFDAFVQIDREENDYLGTGLGLSIVNKLMHQFNSELIVQSKIGIGSTFSFSITFRYDTVTEQTKQEKTIPELLSKNLNVLVVEDNKINQLVTKNTLKKEKISCTVVDNGFLAIDKVKAEEYDLILMDLNMPEINGFDTSKEIRKFNADIPIIALTAYSKDEVFEEITKAGINDIITKPFEAPQLIHLIKMLAL